MKKKRKQLYIQKRIIHIKKHSHNNLSLSDCKALKKKVERRGKN